MPALHGATAGKERGESRPGRWKSKFVDMAPAFTAPEHVVPSQPANYCILLGLPRTLKMFLLNVLQQVPVAEKHLRNTAAVPAEPIYTRCITTFGFCPGPRSRVTVATFTSFFLARSGSSIRLSSITHLLRVNARGGYGRLVLLTSLHDLGHNLVAHSLLWRSGN